MYINNSRRKFLLNGAQAIALASIGGLVWSAFLKQSRSNSFLLRPPAALEEKEFLRHCIKCGLCVEACPFDTLKLASAGDDMPIGTPYFKPREIPCEMCPDIPCVPVCPTNALNPASVKDENGLWEIRDAKMGVAIVDQEHCVAYWGVECDACYRACPLIGEAIRMEVRHNERANKPYHLVPVVDSEVCTGCGKCEHVCVTDKPTIIVLPRNLVLGYTSSDYKAVFETTDKKLLNDIKMQNFSETSKILVM